MVGNWKELQVPLGIAVAGAMLVAGLWAWTRSEFVLAAEFRQYQQSVEQRSLEREKRQTEFEILKLDVKRQNYPQRFDAVDRAVLDKHRSDLRMIDQELRELKQRGR